MIALDSSKGLACPGSALQIFYQPIIDLLPPHLHVNPQSSRGVSISITSSNWLTGMDPFVLRARPSDAPKPQNIPSITVAIQSPLCIRLFSVCTSLPLNPFVIAGPFSSEICVLLHAYCSWPSSNIGLSTGDRLPCGFFPLTAAWMPCFVFFRSPCLLCLLPNKSTDWAVSPSSG